MMEIANSVSALRAHVRRWRRNGDTIALVPTMGALHAGHLALVAAGKAAATRCITSIFVNPTQFGAGEDLARYPRQEARDAELLLAAGCDLLFLPTADAVYPPGFATSVHVGGVSTVMEGAARPGHFDGVATVVAKLLLMATPDIAIFGEKDWQQLAVIRRLVADLDIDTEIRGAPIVREADGLALSSRNAYLSAAERTAAAVLPQALQAAAAAITTGKAPAEAIATACRQLAAAGFVTDYLQLADGDTLQPLMAASAGARLFVAARIGSTRLIDNIAVSPPGRTP